MISGSKRAQTEHAATTTAKTISSTMIPTSPSPDPIGRFTDWVGRDAAPTHQEGLRDGFGVKTDGRREGSEHDDFIGDGLGRNGPRRSGRSRCDEASKVEEKMYIDFNESSGDLP